MPTFKLTSTTPLLEDRASMNYRLAAQHPAPVIDLRVGMRVTYLNQPARVVAEPGRDRMIDIRVQNANGRVYLQRVWAALVKPAPHREERQP